MAEFKDITNKINFPIPEEGQVFRTSDQQNIFKRVGNQIYSIDVNKFPELKSLQGTLPSFNDADVRGLFGVQGGTIGQTDPNIFKTAAPAPSTPEQITKTQSAINPQAGLFTSSTQGFLSEGGLNRPGGNVQPTIDPKQYAPPPGTVFNPPTKPPPAPTPTAGATPTGGGVGTPPAPDYSALISNINALANEGTAEDAEALGKIKIDTKNVSDLFAKVEKTLGDRPTKPTLAEEFATQKQKLGVGVLEDALAGIDAKLAQKDADYASVIEEEEARPVSMAAIGRRQDKLTLEYNRQKRDLVAQRTSVATQINNKYNIIEMSMNFLSKDYNNAVQDYDTKFNNTLQMLNLFRGVEQDKLTAEDRKQDNARANLTVVSGLLKEGNVDYNQLPETTKISIKNMELTAGYPVGFTSFLTGISARKEILFHTTTPDKKAELVYYKDGTVKTIEFGERGGAAAGTTGPTSFQEYELAGGLKGTGKTYAEFIESKGGETESEKLQVARQGIAAYLNTEAGGDGYVSPITFKNARKAWVTEGYSSKDFDESFTSYANPTHIRDYSPDY